MSTNIILSRMRSFIPFQVLSKAQSILMLTDQDVCNDNDIDYQVPTYRYPPLEEKELSLLTHSKISGLMPMMFI